MKKYCVLVLVVLLGSNVVKSFVPNTSILSPIGLSATTVSLQASRRSFFVESTAALVAVPSAIRADEDDNPFIRDLVAKSEANRELYKKQATRVDKLSYSQFQDQYKKPKFIGVKTSDGTTLMVSPEKLQQLKEANRIRVEYAVGHDRDGSEFIDYSKQTLVLIDDAAQN